MRYVIPKTSAVADFYGKARKLHGRTEVRGMQISVENAQGTVRRWYDPHGKESGSTRMLYDYGYIRGTKGTDGDHVDCYVGPNPESETVYVVTQMKKPDFTKVDEQKVMLGFTSAKKAKRAYLAHYNDDRFFGSMKAMNIDAFKAKVFAKENHGELVKGGPYIGPRGGKYADPQHTIPWKEPRSRASAKPRVDPDFGLPLNDDGTVTLYHGTSAAGAKGIRETGELRSAGEPDVYLTTAKVGTGYGDGISVGKPGGKLRVRVEKSMHIVSLQDLVKARAYHKYKSKRPDGKGGWIYEYDEPEKTTGRTGAVPIDHEQIRRMVDRMLGTVEQLGGVAQLGGEGDDRTIRFDSQKLNDGKLIADQFEHPKFGVLRVEIKVQDKPAKHGEFVRERLRGGALRGSVDRFHIALYVRNNYTYHYGSLKKHLRRVLAHEWTHSVDQTAIDESQRVADESERDGRGGRSNSDKGWNDYRNSKVEVTAKIQEIVRGLTDKAAVDGARAAARNREDGEDDPIYQDYIRASPNLHNFASARRILKWAENYSPELSQVLSEADYSPKNKKRIYRAVADTYQSILEGTVKPIEKSMRPEGAGWSPIPGGHKHGFRRRKGKGWEYWYPPEHEKPQASHVAHDEKKWKTATTFTEEQFRTGDYDKDPTHWHWRITDGDMKPWLHGGLDPHSRGPVKVGGRFAKLYTIDVVEDPGNPGFAILRAVDDGTKIMMQHNRIFPIDHNPLGRKRVKASEPAPEAEVKPPWSPTGGKRPKPTSGHAAPGAAAPVFEGSTASKERQPGLYAIENGVYPMRSIERFEVNEDGSKRKVRSEAIAVTDHGKNLLIKEFEPLIASTAKKIARQFALQMQYEKGDRGKRAVNLTITELQRAGVEGLLDAIERYDAESAFAGHAQQFVRDHVRSAAARERLGGVSLPMRHQRNVSRYIAARAQAAKALGVDDPSPEQVAPHFKLLKRHLHSHLSGAQANEAVPMNGYKIAAVREGAQGAVTREGEKVGATDDVVERDTVTHPGKLEWMHLYDSYLKGQASASELFDEDKFALPGLGMGLGYSPEERVSIRQSVSRALDDLADFEFTSEGRKKITYKGDAGEMLALRLGLYGDDEMSVSQIAKKVPIYANGKKLEQRRAEEIVNEMLERAVSVAREKVKDRDAKALMTRAEEKLTPPVPIVSGPTWHEIIRKRANEVTERQIASYREEEKTRLGGLVERSRDRLAQASGPNALQHEHALRAAEEAARRIDRMTDEEVRMKIATRLAPETAEMRRLMTQTITVDVPAPRGFEYGSMVLMLTDLGSGAQRNVRVRTLRDLRDAEDREMEKSQASEKRRADATLTSGMLREAIHYPRTMRLLISPEEQIAGAPTIARRTLELLSGLGE